MEVLLYLLIFGWQYAVPLVLTAVLTLLIHRILSRRGWRWPILGATGIAVALSCLPALSDRVTMRRDLAALAPDSIRPDQLTLPPGRLLHLQNMNTAGITCREECPFAQLPFVSDVTVADIQRVTDPEGYPPSRPIDLWAALDNPDRNAPFPYSYAFISATSYWYAKGIGATDYRLPHWPETTSGAHMLVSVPPDGQLDLAHATTHYRRLNLQLEQAEWGLWGFASRIRNIPSTGAIFDDLSTIAKPD
ncbi:hypothetical protein FNJ84_15910 [Paracoccus sp. M683]|uniref:hypothetical protein n=1 Tax=Paracoccus sp. M683 TaxID=2594268 RepID=UPI00117D3C85|nr:hypothetical protein [Paracoccus sp. M683]TRW95471.1 hypothetical protein FNJ84_15910 [Paracoccus sp. M683]